MKVFHPVIVGAVSSVLLLLFTFINPSSYSFYIKEPSYMYMNMQFYLYILFCTLMFCIMAAISAEVTSRREYRVFSPSNSLVNILGFFGIFISLVKLYFVQTSFGINRIIASYQGNAAGYLVKDDLNEAISGGRIGWITDVSIIIIIILTWTIIERRDRKFIKPLYLANIVLFILISLLSLSRDALTTVIIASVFIYLASLKGSLLVVLRKYLSVILLASLGFVALFAVVDQARNGGDARNQIITQVYGYFPASINRAAAIFDGKLKYPNSASGYYSTQFIWDLPFISSALGLPQTARWYGLDIPLKPDDNWEDQFKAVSSYGLNERYIWATVFGFVYSDFSNFGYIYFMIYGLLCGMFFSLYKKRSIYGIILYSFAFTTIIKWGSVISFSQRILVICLLFAILCDVFGRIRIQGRR